MPLSHLIILGIFFKNKQGMKFYRGHMRGSVLAGSNSIIPEKRFRIGDIFCLIQGDDANR